MITLKIGIDQIFAEPLTNLNQGQNSYALNTTLNTTLNTSFASSSVSRTFYKKPAEVTPKFSTSNTTRAQLKENVLKIQNKTGVLEKILQIYFNDKEQNSNADSNEINEIENDMIKQKGTLNVFLSNDYYTHKILCNFLSSLESESNKHIDINSSVPNSFEPTEEEYKGMSDLDRQNLLDYIHKYKNELITNLGVNIYKKDTLVVPTSSNVKVTYETQNSYDTKKFNLFRMYVDNKDLPDEHVAHYFNANVTNMIQAIEKYFQNSYQSTELVLYYSYPETTIVVNSKEVKHYFSFVASIDELFNQVKVDFPRLTNFRLFALNGTEITRNSTKKFIGALHLLNKSVIRVKY